MKKIAISGYFDPIHVGHIEYINNAKKLGDWLVVIVNNNNQCALKKGKYFMDEKDRVLIVKNIKAVDEVFLSIDEDKTVCKSLIKRYTKYGNSISHVWHDIRYSYSNDALIYLSNSSSFKTINKSK